MREERDHKAKLRQLELEMAGGGAAEAPPAADIESSDAAQPAEKAPEAEKPLDIQSSGRRRLRGGA